MRSIKTYFHILRHKGFRYSFHEVWKLTPKFYFVRDRSLLNLISETKAYAYLKKYKYVLNRPIQNHTTSSNPYPNKIWICWLQGENQAPLLVRKCIESIRKNANGREVILLTQENLKQYITFPEYILKKKEKGIISNTHFSDLIRITLLASYGGLWLDATVFLTDRLPDYILNTPLFCFKTSLFEPGKIKASSWLIQAEPQNEIIVQTRNICFEYWKHENYMIHYYIFHLLFSIVIDSKPELRQQWEEVPYYNNINPHVLLFELFHPFDEKRLKQLLTISSVHKLSYKFSNQKTDVQGTFYQKLLSDSFEEFLH